jgi:hypothetical protein
MSIFTSEDKELQAAAGRAGLRTFGQTLEVGLGTGAVGGIVVGTTNDGGNSVFAVSWLALLGYIGFVLLAALLAGFRSYLSIVTKGLPQQYVDAAAKGLLTGTATTTVTDPGGDHVADSGSHSA